MNDDREYLEDGITPKYPKHYTIECESGKFDTDKPKVEYPSFGTAYVPQGVIHGNQGV